MAAFFAGGLGWGISFWGGPEGRLHRSHEMNEGESLDMAGDPRLDEVGIDP